MKQCTGCKEVKNSNEFWKLSTSASGLQGWCKSCTNHSKLKKSRTKIGLVTMIYKSQRTHSRLRGHGEPQYTLSELYDWLQSTDEFNILFITWADSEYQTELKPSCDRLDDADGYNFDNLQVLTWGANRTKYHNRNLDTLNN